MMGYLIPIKSVILVILNLLHISLVFDIVCVPYEACSEAGHYYLLTSYELTLVIHLLEKYRDARRSAVACVHDVHRELLDRLLQLLGCCLDDPLVCLVEDEVVYPVQIKTVLHGQVRDDLRDFRYGELEDFPAVHAKVFEQCAGFLRIPGAANPLDNTAVHPERYALVERMAADAGVPTASFLSDEAIRSGIDLKRYVSGDVGMPTLTDVMAEIAKRGRDPRGAIHVFEFSQEIQSIDDVRVGMILPCVVTNVTAFGAFVDIGIHEHGLIHVSQMADKYVSDPSKVLKVHQQLEAKVVSVDLDRRRIGLSLKGMKR